MKHPLSTLLALLALTSCTPNTPATPTQPAPPATTATPATPAMTAMTACTTAEVDPQDPEVVADAAAYYLTCIDAADTHPTDQLTRARPYLTDQAYTTVAASTGKPSRYWNATISHGQSTTVTIERLYMDTYDPTATGSITLDRAATATSPTAGTQTTYYTLTLEPSPTGYAVSSIAATTGS